MRTFIIGASLALALTQVGLAWGSPIRLGPQPTRPPLMTNIWNWGGVVVDSSRCWRL